MRTRTATALFLSALGSSAPPVAALSQSEWVDPPPYNAPFPQNTLPPDAPRPRLPEQDRDRAPAVVLKPEVHPEGDNQSAAGVSPAPSTLKDGRKQPEPLGRVRTRYGSPMRDRAEAARRLLIEYLASWSDRTVVTRDIASAFYRPTVEFYGRRLSLEAVVGEKRRFIDRWPVRDYVAQPETVHASCEPNGPSCKVEGLFSFLATNPAWGRRSRGTGQLELGVTFDGERPFIASETSRIVSRIVGRNEVKRGFEE